ncbi:SRPBCC family protein [Thalassiella azotivora]
MSSPSQSTAEETTGEPVRVTRSVGAPVEKVWELLISAQGTEDLLGRGATLGNKGEPWHAEDGTEGVVRSYHPMEQLRVSWHADAGAPRTLVDLHLVAEDSGTRLDLVHEHLPGDADREVLRTRWEEALARLESTLG